MSVRSEAAAEAAPAERRFVRRRKVLINGVVADVNGTVADCAILDINEGGAQIKCANVPAKDELYLIDTRSETAFLVRVAWRRRDRAGLAFAQAHSLLSAVAPEQQFLIRVLLEARLRQVRALMKVGRAADDAARIVGITADYLERIAATDAFSDNARLLIKRANDLLR
jgi:hypothetical protein